MSPQKQIEWLVEQFRTGKADAAACHIGLDAVETYFHDQAARLDATGATDDELAGPTEAFQLFLDAVEHLRAYVDGDEASADVGLELAEQGQLAVDATLEQNARRRDGLLAELAAAREAGVTASDSWGRLEG